jgi:membrane protease YdiL (CAAX protease family)
MGSSSETGIKLKPMPILKMLIVTLIVALFICVVNERFLALPYYGNQMLDSSWVLAVLVHVPQFLIPFIIIIYISGGGPGRYGFNLVEDQPQFTHKRMLSIGILSGLIMSLKYIINVVNGLPLDIPQPVTPINVLGHVSFQWIVVGLSEETMFRGLIQTYLMENLEGSVNILGHILHIGTIVAAFLWGGFHIINVINMPFSAALMTVIVTTPIGLLMGYAYQRTGSLLTTILVHNSLFGVPLTIGYVLYFIGF